MALFLFIALVMFFLFAKFYTIAKKKDVINGNDAHSAFFSVFMFACTILWLAFTYAFKTSVFVLVCLLCWPNIKKFFREYNGDAPKETAQIQANECSVSARTQ